MASPPPAFTPATSPSYPSHASLPSSKKPSGAKRRKASTMSITSATSSAHPLRQTSFPPDAQGGYSPSYERSPSVDTMSMVSGSLASGAPGKKKRGRKSKTERARQAAGDASAARDGTPSLVNGPAGSTVSGTKGDGGDDDGDGGADGGAGLDIPENMASKAAARSKEQIVEEEKHRALMKQRMTEDQFRRYEVWHQSKLTMAVVKKYINLVTSQSVQPTIPQAMQVVLKLVIGDIVEEARAVQKEWQKAGEKQTDLTDDKEDKQGLSPLSYYRRQAPLRPDHLQEAYRRWRNSNQFGGTGGSMMYWHQQTRNGAERFAPRFGGKRLFK